MNILRTGISAIALLVVACGGGSGSKGPSVALENTTDFAGVVGVPGSPTSAAALTLTAGNALTGVITQANGNSGLLVGTYNSTNGALNATGLGYTLTATVTSGVFIGQGFVNLGFGQFVKVGTVGVSAPTTATEVWAGRAQSNAGQNCGSPKQTISEFQFVLHPSGTAYVVVGQTMNDGDGTQATFKGTAAVNASAGTGTMTVTMDAPVSFASATGALVAGVWSGTYRGGDASGCEQGTWTAAKLR